MSVLFYTSWDQQGRPHRRDSGETEAAWSDAFLRVFVAVFIAEWGDRTQETGTKGRPVQPGRSF